MSFNIGDVVSNEEIVNEFGVGNMGGMRRSIANNCLVIIADHTKDLYDDNWHDNILLLYGYGSKR